MIERNQKKIYQQLKEALRVPSGSAVGWGNFQKRIQLCIDQFAA